MASTETREGVGSLWRTGTVNVRPPVHLPKKLGLGLVLLVFAGAPVVVALELLEVLEEMENEDSERRLREEDLRVGPGDGEGELAGVLYLSRPRGKTVL